MKHFLYNLFICLFVVSCKNETQVVPVTSPPDGYEISGAAPGLVNGLRVYLKSTNEKGTLKDQDTAIILNERFRFDGKVKKREAWFVEVNSLDGSFPFVIDNSNLTLVINKDDISLSKIDGDSLNNAIDDFNSQLKKLNDSLSDTRDKYKQMIANQENASGMSEKVIDIMEAISNLPHEFIKNNTNNPYSLVLLNTMIRRNASEEGLILQSFEALNDSLMDSNLGKRVAKSIPEIKRRYNIIAATNIGEIAPNFSAPNPNGYQIELNKIKGKATLIHFWASWYQASRRENPKLVEIYEKYHDKGLEMISVSLDGNSNQTNPKADWKKAVQEDKLIWNQVSNLNYFNDTISKAYNVRSLPSYFLLDDKGVIVAKDKTGNSIETMLEELLD
jgi:thiol-disulfide isomerase/thioredoxin